MKRYVAGWVRVGGVEEEGGVDGASGADMDEGTYSEQFRGGGGWAT